MYFDLFEKNLYYLRSDCNSAKKEPSEEVAEYLDDNQIKLKL